MLEKARIVTGCQTGKLTTRKSTDRSNSDKECYALSAFNNDDNSEIQDIFSKQKTSDEIPTDVKSASFWKTENLVDTKHAVT